MPSESIEQEEYCKAMAVRRLKTYAGASGFVYEYYFVGKRPLAPADIDAPGNEYVFDISSGRRPAVAVTVVLPEAALNVWRDLHGRALATNEQYAAAKLYLLRRLDEDRPLTETARLSIARDSLDALLSPLDL